MIVSEQEKQPGHCKCRRNQNNGFCVIGPNSIAELIANFVHKNIVSESVNHIANKGCVPCGNIAEFPYKYNIQVLGDFETHLKDDIVKLSIYKKDTVEAEVKEWFYPKWKDRFVIASAGTMWMDIVNPGADKGSALKKLMKELELSKEEVMAFGDNINDLGMLEAAGESYAIGSARQEVKDAAKHIAPPLNIYGETIALREFLEKQGWYDTTLR